jgi:FKBP-type peptidyl-prolyl cis-trans isomerase
MKSVKIIGFLIVAVAVIAVGQYVNGRIDEKAEKELFAQQKAMQDAEQQLEGSLVKKDEIAGTGAEALPGDDITVNYVGTLEDGTKFDSSYDRGTPFDFKLGSGAVIRGWDLGVVGMRVGGKRDLVIPAGLAYGDKGIGPIPPNATLHFTVELVAIKGK